MSFLSGLRIYGLIFSARRLVDPSQRPKTRRGGIRGLRSSSQHPPLLRRFITRSAVVNASSFEERSLVDRGAGRYVRRRGDQLGSGPLRGRVGRGYPRRATMKSRGNTRRRWGELSRVVYVPFLVIGIPQVSPSSVLRPWFATGLAF